jgi:hypothetical protein
MKRALSALNTSNSTARAREGRCAFPFLLRSVAKMRAEKRVFSDYSTC